MVRVAREGQAKPHSRHPRTLERPKTKGRSPREEQPCPQGPGLIQQDKSSSLSVNPPLLRCIPVRVGTQGNPRQVPISWSYQMRHRDRTPQSRLAVAAGR